MNKTMNPLYITEAMDVVIVVMDGESIGQISRTFLPAVRKWMVEDGTTGEVFICKQADRDVAYDFMEHLIERLEKKGAKIINAPMFEE